MIEYSIVRGDGVNIKMNMNGVTMGMRFKESKLIENLAMYIDKRMSCSLNCSSKHIIAFRCDGKRLRIHQEIKGEVLTSIIINLDKFDTRKFVSILREAV